MKQYRDLLVRILTDGEERNDRTGVGTISIFSGEIEFDLRKRFPLVTMKKTHWKKSFIEKLWFIRGEPHLKYMHEHNNHIWDDWAKDEEGNLGPIYGVQWRRFYGRNREVDQLAQLIEGIKNNPTDRRHIVTAWNPADLPEMALPPCHYLFQCYVTNDGQLDLKLSIRSWDTAIGAPFNIAQYALLTHLIARATNLTPRRLIISYGDAHIYKNHIGPITQMLAEQEPIECPTKLLFFTDNTNIDGYKPEDFGIEDYESGPFINLEIAV